MFRRAKIWSIQPFPFLNPACSSLSLLSTTLLSLLMIILARILLGMESRVIPRQLLQSFNAPFFGILIMVALFQSSGILLSCQTFTMRGRRISAAIAGSVLKSSALRLSGPGALLFLGPWWHWLFLPWRGWFFYLKILNSYWDVWLSFRWWSV